MFMPPNVTPLIQPMDQNAIRITKLYYRNSLLASIAAKGGGLIETMKQTTLKEAIIILESAWRRMDSVVLSKCWKNILNIVVNQDDPEDEIPLSVVRENLQMNLRKLEESAANVLCTLLPEVEYTVSNVKEWNEDAIEYEDNEVEAISDEDDCVEEPKRTIKPGEAVDIFNKALDWAESEMVEQRVLNVLRDLREKAVLKFLDQKKQQKRITDFFKH